MIRLFTMMSLMAGVAACAAPPPSEALRDRPVSTGASRDAAELARPGGQPVPVNFNPLDTGVSTMPGSGGGGY